jgi:hypothetical protein
VKIEGHTDRELGVELIRKRRPEKVGIIVIIKVDHILGGVRGIGRRNVSIYGQVWSSLAESGTAWRIKLKFADRLGNAEKVREEREVAFPSVPGDDAVIFFIWL